MKEKIETYLNWKNSYWHLLAVVAGAIATWTGIEMMSLQREEQLWSYRPLVLLSWSYICLSALWAGFRKIANAELRHYFVATCVAILMGISFPPIPLLVLIVPAWAFFIHLIHSVSKKSRGYQFRLFFHTFILWNIITTYWIGNTAFAAGIVAIFTNTLLMTVPILLFNFSRQSIKIQYHFIAFASCWLSFEFFHFRWEAHWPWLALGHYFMDQPWLIQWYEVTGVLGGTLYILGLSWLLYQLMIATSKEKRRSNALKMLVLLVVPIIFSIALSSRQIDSTGETNVAIIQPNYEPHYEKDRIPDQMQMQRFISLANKVVTDETDYLLFPETCFGINLNNWENNRNVKELNAFLDQHPNLTLIAGLATNKILKDGDEHDKFTRTYVRSNDTIYWENHNTAVRMSSGKEMEIYYKSKLVPGAEFFPFQKILFFMKPLMDKLGGSASGLRTQAERETLDGLDNHQAAPIICYESVYGEYVSEYVEAGADFFTVMTNDGWWDRTAGHKQHLGLSVLRAIEQRKSIARAANTGISCFINPKGEIISPTKYREAISISGTIQTNEVRTIYSRAGDILGRLALLILIGMLLKRVLLRWIKK